MNFVGNRTHLNESEDMETGVILALVNVANNNE